MYFLIALSTFGSITTQSLLNEMNDLSRLTQRSTYAYRTIESSSYDRKSVSAKEDGWFANSDWGQYTRQEANEGRQEFVMADYKGPGAVVRLWSANPMGTMRFYFDGESKPRLVARMDDLLHGKVAPWDDRFSYISSMGTNLYFPFPFAKSLKVTVAADNGEDKIGSIYYQLNTRMYDPATPVETFTPLTKVAALPELNTKADATFKKQLAISSEGSAEVTLNSVSPSEICKFALENLNKGVKVGMLHPRSTENLLKHIEICLSFDGQETVRAPLPDFFGAGILPGKLDTLVAKADGGLTMSQMLPMPYQRKVTVKLINHNKFGVKFGLNLNTRKTEGSDYVLHAQWTADTNSSRPMRDFNFVNFFGEGRFVGAVLHVQNPTPGWWGEGDEKVFVDGEKFPSWIGTGTEDYFGYAWCNPELFSRPYHGQARADGPANAGQVGNVRWHVMDDIPFQKKIDFSLEIWHWEDVPSRFDGTAFWYAKPGRWTAPAVQTKSLELIDGPKPIAPVKGAIEGETLKIVSKTGGITEVQGYTNLSSGKQLWWKDAADGEALEMTFDVEKAGTYTLVSNSCFATDYGIHEMFVNGVSVGTKDFYAPDLKWEVTEWGKVQLKKGPVQIRVVARGSNAKANPARRMFGLDYLLLKGA